MKWFFDLEIQYKLTIIGIFATALMSALSLYFSIRNNRAVHYVNSVTKNRVDWITNLRKLVSEYLALIDTSDLTENCLTPDEMLKYNINKRVEVVRQRGCEIQLMLNFSDKFDKLIIGEIALSTTAFKLICESTLAESIKSKKNDEPIYIPNDEIYSIQKKMEEYSDKLQRDFQIYLKSEWNRVKCESKGKKYEKIVQNFDIAELEKIYDDEHYSNQIWKRKCIVLWSKVRKMPPICTFIYIKKIWVERKSVKQEKVS